MEKVAGLFGGGGGQMQALRRAQTAQAEAIARQQADVTAKELALQRLFRGGAGIRLSGGSELASALGG